ncbi:hypothetical protein HB364_29340 [Pseudoflavitalea sp. X16]|uniref:hypothetical protein n=1 Tax=Paraflavitalea devenefica TaxID=2716334 RepID=UPI00141FC13E|nr:hypothetical protein [Paraflavitalea devenefica]NII29220.1 hypothetical protein [Paraflavitalea devenefica]
MRTLFFTLTCMLLTVICPAQQYDTVLYRTNGRVDGYHLALLPAGGVSKGLLVFIPGASTEADDMMKETDLPVKAQAAGYTVVITYLSNRVFFDSANVLQTRLEQLVKDASAKYKTPAGKFIIGGHSIGGHQAMIYTEKAMMPGSKAIKPAAVFGVDPPLDMKRLYNGYQRVLAAGAGGEALYVTTRFNSIYGGPPEQFPAAYEAASSFYRDAANGGNARFLKDIPVHLYCDPDVIWFVNERNIGVEWTNLADTSACIATLRKLGNGKAELVTNLGKGYLPDGKRHPHAFSQVQAPEFLGWVAEVLKGI